MSHNLQNLLNKVFLVPEPIDYQAVFLKITGRPIDPQKIKYQPVAIAKY